ncbi:MAG: nitrogen fixation protein NifX [Arcobacteraceae bacterium]|jgi:nitrogen fixation protein NifX|nr:nitrogen fixation protein NifX [Arcobacteraceae bacterium]MDY0327482.1 nitrogen fixation protein NifX [Arcobacteraceae bacterium]
MNTNIKVSGTKNITGLKIAFATNDMENIDAHFGSCNKFSVYDVSKDGHELSGIINTKEEKGKEGDKTANIINALKGIDIVYFLDIGPIAAAKVINNKIFPIKYKEIVSIEQEVNKLTNMLASNPPPFIKKIVESKGL